MPDADLALFAALLGQATGDPSAAGEAALLLEARAGTQAVAPYIGSATRPT
jgi:hypothetical protein